MTLEDFLVQVRDHDTAKQIAVHVEGIDGVFTNAEVDKFESNTTTLVIRVIP
jgi:hypothetical protein